jgi:hypothetical protein
MNTLKSFNRWFDGKSQGIRFSLVVILLLLAAYLGGTFSRITHSDLGLGVYFGIAFLLIWLRGIR